MAQQTPDPLEEAEQFYHQGLEHYDQGDYDQAVHAFNEAYNLAQDPILSYNLALAKWRTGDPESAIETMERALSEGLPSDLEASARTRVIAWRSAVDSRAQAMATATRVDALKSIDTGDDTPPDTVAAPDTTDASSRTGPLSWVGAVTSVAGVGGLVGAAVLNRQVGQRGSELEANSQLSPDERRTLLDGIETRQRIGVPLLFGGALMVASGVGMIVFDRRQNKTERAHHSRLQWSIALHDETGFPLLSIRGYWH